MNKVALAEAIADRTGLSKKQAEDFLEAFVDTVTDTLMTEESVTIAGFGAFSAKFRHARMGVNPQSPSQRMEIPAVWIPKFKAGKGLKDALKKMSTGGSSTDGGSEEAPAEEVAAPAMESPAPAPMEETPSEPEAPSQPTY